MKQISQLSIFLLILIAFPTIVVAQSKSLSELSNRDIAIGLIKGTIEYSSVPLSRNNDVYREFRWMCGPVTPMKYNRTIPSSSFYNSKYFLNSGNFYSRFPNTILLNFLDSNPAYVEVEEKGDIYTRPVASQNIENDGSFVLYTDKMESKNAFAFYTTIYGRQYSRVQENMNMMKINKQQKPILDVLKGVELRNAQIINPRQVVPIGKSGTLLFSYSVTYREKPTNIIYSSPTFIALAGQIFQVDDGVHYEVPLHDIGYLSLIDGKTMTCQNTVSFEDIANPTLFCYTDFAGEQKVYCTESSFYKTPQSNSSINRWRVLSQNGSPIYILSNDFRDIYYKIIPGDGDVVLDMVETPEYYIYCGTNKKHGYVGYDNPTLVIIDKKNGKEIARYNSCLGSDRKGKICCRVLLLSSDKIYLEILGDSYYEHNYSEMGFNGRSANECLTEIIRISSLVNE